MQVFDVRSVGQIEQGGAATETISRRFPEMQN